MIVSSTIVSRRIQVSAFLVAATVSTLSAARADVLPLGEIFAVNGTTAGAQSSADIIRSVGSGFLVAYQGSTLAPPHTGGQILQRAFTRRAKPLGMETGLSEIAAPVPSDRRVHLARMRRGNFAAVWYDETGRDGDQSGVFGGIFSSDGSRLAPEFQVNLEQTTGLQSDATVGQSAGNILVAWQDYGSDKLGPIRIPAQRFDSTGSRLGDELVLALQPEDVGFLPQSTGLRGSRRGDVIVVWESIPGGESGAGFDVAAKIVASNGEVTGRILISGTQFDEGSPTVAATPDGFIVAWTHFGESGQDVYARRFSNELEPLGDTFLVNTYTDGDQSGASIAVSSSGSFVIAWVSAHPTDPLLSQDGYGIGGYAQGYSADGTRIGSEFQVSERTLGHQGPTSAAFINPVDFVVVWNDTGLITDYDVHARRFRLTETYRLCGDSVGSDLSIHAADAIRILGAASGRGVCDLCSCDVDGSGAITIDDAALVLESVVGLAIATACPVCN